MSLYRNTLTLLSISFLLLNCHSSKKQRPETTNILPPEVGCTAEICAETDAPIEQGALEFPIEGLHYTSGDQQGTTGPKGKFLYTKGEMIKFRIGEFELAQLEAAPSLSFTALSQAQNIRSTESIKLLTYLIALDTDQDMYNGVQLQTEIAETTARPFNDISSDEYSLVVENTGDVKAYIFIDWFNPVKLTQLSAGNHHTLGLNIEGKAFSFGENFGGILNGDEPNKYCDGKLRNKLGRNSDLDINPSAELATMPKDGLSEAEGLCYISLMNARLYGSYNIHSDWIDVDSSLRFIHISTDQTDGTLITDNGELYVFGPNNWGQLGQGHTTPIDYPTPVMLPENERIVFATSASANVYFITHTGKVYSAGANNNLQLGRKDDSVELDASFARVQGLEHEFIVKLAVRDHHVYALNEQGDVFAWGNNSAGGELGNGTINEDSAMPVKILSDQNIINVETGADFGLAVNGGGTVYGWGNNIYGALAMGTPTLSESGASYRVEDVPNQTTPHIIENLSPEALNGDRVIAFQGGSRNAHALTLNGDIYSWGDSGSGYFGNGYSIDESGIERRIVVQPEKVTALDDIEVAKFSSNTSNNFAVSTDNTVYAWGSTAHGRLGVPLDFCAGKNQNTYGEEASTGVCYTPFEIDLVPTP